MISTFLYTFAPMIWNNHDYSVFFKFEMTTLLALYFKPILL